MSQQQETKLLSTHTHTELEIEVSVRERKKEKSETNNCNNGDSCRGRARYDKTVLTVVS